MTEKHLLFFKIKPYCLSFQNTFINFILEVIKDNPGMDSIVDDWNYVGKTGVACSEDFLTKMNLYYI